MTPTVADTNAFAVPPLAVGGRTLHSRLVVGTGKYADHDTMRAAIDASGADCVTVAVVEEQMENAGMGRFKRKASADGEPRRRWWWPFGS